VNGFALTASHAAGGVLVFAPNATTSRRDPCRHGFHGQGTVVGFGGLDRPDLGSERPRGAWLWCATVVTPQSCSATTRSCPQARGPLVAPKGRASRCLSFYVTASSMIASRSPSGTFVRMRAAGEGACGEARG
jgi:hypothetical protein